MSTTTIEKATDNQTPASQPAAPIAVSRAIAKLAGIVAATLTATTVLVAVVVDVAFTGPACGWLHYRFLGVPANPTTAAIIFAHNGRTVLGVLGLLMIAQLAFRTTNRNPSIQRTVQAGGELVLAGVIASNALVVGAAVGAYRARMVTALLPHGPVELAAYTLALRLYLHGRRQPLPPRILASTIGASVILLALAAVLATWVSVCEPDASCSCWR